MNPKKRQQLIIIGVIVAVVIVGVGVAIGLSGGSKASSVDFSKIPQSRTEDGAFVLGNPDAPITIIEFADFGCPHCQEYKNTMDQFISEYVVTGRAKFEYRMFPTAGGQLTVFAGQLAECAEEIQPGAFWKAYELFYRFAETGRYSQDMGRLLAQELGLEYGKLLECSSSANQVTTDTNFGRASGITGTPAVMIRYGDSAPSWVSIGGQQYNRGSVPYSALQAVMQTVQ